MKIYKMTATFGKLEHETLTLEPGLNVIEAPNEWGKTTWCAFLITMFYGIDTRAKTTKTALAEKEKYAPWSGSPMSGRIDLNWNGRDITIERSSKGRTPMGVFRAYETDTGLAVPELTASTCGALLLGAEQSVYRRTGFIRQSDMPVTQDDALRRRLNALVTTGDETGDSDRLAAELKDLKNKCRYNRSGLLPQAEARRKELEDKITELETLAGYSRNLRERLDQEKERIRLLENHRDALLYKASEADAARVAEARDRRDQAEDMLTELEQRCSRLPAREEVDRKISAIESYREELAVYQAEEARSAEHPQMPVPPELFRGMTLEQAEDMVTRDVERHEQLTGKKPWLVFTLLGWALLILAVPAVLMEVYTAAAVFGAAGVLLLIIGAQRKKEQRRLAKELEEKYGSAYPDAWLLLLRNYEAEKKAFDQAMLDYRVARGDLDIRRTFLLKQREALFGSQAPDQVLEIWQQMRKSWAALDRAKEAFQQAEHHLNILQDMAKPSVQQPKMEDKLTCSAAETENLLREAQLEQQRLHSRMGQYEGRMEALGSAEDLHADLAAVNRRIEKLEETYSAVTLALETLTQARQSLQRKFAPRIAGRARELLSRMTGGRYDRLTFNEDLSLLAGAGQEEVLREVLWRSDGTVDQLYLALRLAVAEELIPDVPLVLDDAFVRFDDTRLKAALEILRETAREKQVILFTCQSREKEYCGK